MSGATAGRAGGGADGGGVLGRLVSGRPVPPGMVAAVGGRESWEAGECAYVVMVGATGPARVHYSLTEPVGPTWLRLVAVSERRRRRVLAAVLRSGALEGVGRGGAEGTPFGWFHAAAGARSVWTDLPADGRVGGVAVRDLVAGLVPGWAWEELHARRDEAWAAWARRSGPVPVPGMEVTRRDAGGGFDPDATRREAVDQGPWDRAVAGRRAEQQGWPGIRHGGGLGGAW